MKNIFYGLILLSILGLQSCKKDYTCTCKLNGVSQSRVIHDTKSNATDECNKDNKDGVMCELK